MLMTSSVVFTLLRVTTYYRVSLGVFSLAGDAVQSRRCGCSFRPVEVFNLGRNTHGGGKGALRRWVRRMRIPLSFFTFPKLYACKIASTNMLERLNEEIRRRTRVVGIFPNPDSYLRLVSTFLMEYAEDWLVSRAYLSEEIIRTLLPQAAYFIC
jgi:hypothetical protein